MSTSNGRTQTSAWLVGEGTLLVRCAEVYRHAGHTLTGIASSDPAVLRWADQHHIRVVPANAGLAAVLAEAPFDYLFSIVNLRRLDAAVIAAPRMLAVNFHDGLLPQYAGLNTPVWALLNGETEYGVTWHEMTAEIDAGRVLKQQRFEIPEGETSFGLNARCYEAGLAAFTSLVEDISAGHLDAVEQSRVGRTMYLRHQRPDGHGVVDWTQPAAAIARAVRAMDFGPYQNPFGVVRLLSNAGAYVLSAASPVPHTPGSAPGVVEHLDAARIVVATGEGSLAIEGVRRVTGEPLALAEFAAEAGLHPGRAFAGTTPPARDAMERATRRESAWTQALARIETVTIPYASEPAGTSAARRATFAGIVPAALRRERADDDQALRLVASVAAYLTRLSGQPAASFALASEAPPASGLPLLADRVPVTIDASSSWTEMGAAVAERDTAARERGSFFTDVCLRYPAEASLKSFARWRDHVVLDPARRVTPAASAVLVVRPGPDGSTLEWDARADVFPSAVLERLHAQWIAFATHASATPDSPLSSIPLVAGDERARLLDDWNETTVAFQCACIHDSIEQQVRRTPDGVALVWGQDALTYRDLDARANRLARHLQSLGVGPESRVGLCLERSIDLVVGLLAVLKAGGAYVPLDPHYPRERLALVAEDAQIEVAIVDDRRVADLGACRHLVVPSRDRAAIERLDDAPVGTTATPENLAYIIYTSGSTGRPKGVMLEHRQVANFFAGMDACVPHDPPGVWLAVTSISFDISVLELFWTLARGFTVVLYGGEAGTSLATRSSTRPEPIDLSLFYFSADEGQDARHKYRLLLEGAKFADTHGFSAVWTPERHFHAFGGLYPNPAVTGAAVAAITSRVAIRAGSCVLPLHHPLRVAEEWSVVDNISGGRVGIAFASGWQPNDFILRPESYADRKNVLLRGIETVRALWRGEAVTFTSPRGEQQEIRTLPRPVQPTLPTWITAAGNPETFAAAATAGAGLLTHLLGQTVDELTAKIAAYRDAWKAAGHAGTGHVVLMLHTLVSTDDDYVRDVVREPLMAYLKTSIDLVKPFAESFPTFAARSGESLSAIFAQLSEDDYNALVEHSFNRYYETSGLFGRPETCLAMIDRLKAIGVDEIACLVDFGVATDVVLENLPHLADLRERANGIPPAHDESMAGLIARHRVTHLQCTPSMARMLLLDPASRAALGRLRAMFVGGEALPAALASDLLDALGGGHLWNMYGPTETTVWSTVSHVERPVETVTIGRPIANTQIYILDAAMQPVPVGLPGDLYIGGDGVARGYWRRPDLTADRFRPNPFLPGDGGRLYATGDVARYRDDGTIDFLGRSDHQVKIRGHRIELGEIEAALTALPGVREAVVVAREDHAGDKRLVAYVIAQSGAAREAAAIRSALGARLPDFLVPSHVVFLDAFPLTPNNKIDRRALPAAEDVAAVSSRPVTAPVTETEETVVAVWREVLRSEHVGTDDNFFDIGGDSLLAAQVLSLLRGRLSQPVSLTDLFRFPTVRTLSAHLGGGVPAADALAGSTDRARARQEALKQRRAPAGTRR